MAKKGGPVTPGTVLYDQFMEPNDISQNKLAGHIKVPVTRIHDIIHGRRGITADTALRLAIFFGTTPEYWMGLQTDYDLEVTTKSKLAKIKKEVVKKGKAPAKRK
jgi:antitoxin HigA-1